MKNYAANCSAKSRILCLSQKTIPRYRPRAIRRISSRIQCAMSDVLAGDSGWILDADLSRGAVATAEEFGKLRVYELPLGGLTHEWSQGATTYVPGNGGLGSAKFTPDGQTVASARWWDFAPWAWAWRSGGQPRQLEAGDGFLRRLAVSSDGATVAAGDSTNPVIIWNLSSGKVIEELRRESDKNYQVTDVRYVTRSSLIAAASTEGTIRLFDPDVSQQSVRTLGEVGGSPITSLDVSADGTYLASVSDDRTVRIWRIPDGKLMQTMDVPQNTLADVAFSPDGTVVAVGAADGAVHLWRWRDNYKLALLQRRGDSVNSVKFFPDGSKIISVSDDGTAPIYPCTHASRSTTYWRRQTNKTATADNAVVREMGCAQWVPART